MPRFGYQPEDEENAVRRLALLLGGRGQVDPFAVELHRRYMPQAQQPEAEQEQEPEDDLTNTLVRGLLGGALKIREAKAAAGIQEQLQGRENVTREASAGRQLQREQAGRRELMQQQHELEQDDPFTDLKRRGMEAEIEERKARAAAAGRENERNIDPLTVELAKGAAAQGDVQGSYEALGKPMPQTPALQNIARTLAQEAFENSRKEYADRVQRWVGSLPEGVNMLQARQQLEQIQQELRQRFSAVPESERFAEQLGELAADEIRKRRGEGWSPRTGQASGERGDAAMRFLAGVDSTGDVRRQGARRAAAEWWNR